MSYNQKTNLHEGYIYCITNQVNNKKYIGQTINTIENRYGEHIRHCKNNKYHLLLYTAMCKHGITNFSIEEVSKVIAPTKKELIKKLNEKEIELINFFSTLKPNGYNMVPGGNVAGNTYPSKMVKQYDTNRNVVATFDSISDAARMTGFDYSDISHCCAKKKVKMVHGYIFRFIEDNLDVPVYPKGCKPVKQIVCGSITNTYNSIKQASLSTGISGRAISKCCQGMKGNAGGFEWQFAT